IDVLALVGLRRPSLEIDIYGAVKLKVAARPDALKPAKPRKARAGTKRRKQNIRGGAVLFKYFRHIARGDLEALFPNVRVVMSLSDHFTLGVPALVGGVPILLKLASTLTVLFVVAGFRSEEHTS